MFKLFEGFLDVNSHCKKVQLSIKIYSDRQCRMCSSLTLNLFFLLLHSQFILTFPEDLLVLRLALYFAGKKQFFFCASDFSRTVFTNLWIFFSKITTDKNNIPTEFAFLVLFRPYEYILPAIIFQWWLKSIVLFL